MTHNHFQDNHFKIQPLRKVVKSHFIFWNSKVAPNSVPQIATLFNGESLLSSISATFSGLALCSFPETAAGNPA